MQHCGILLLKHIPAFVLTLLQGLKIFFSFNLMNQEYRILALFSMCKLVSNLQQKFIRKKLLSGVDSKNLLILISRKRGKLCSL